MSDNNNCNELSEILLYDGNDEEFKQYNESLDQPLNSYKSFKDIIILIIGE